MRRSDSGAGWRGRVALTAAALIVVVGGSLAARGPGGGRAVAAAPATPTAATMGGMAMATPTAGRAHAGGVRLMTEGALQMRLLPLSGKAPTWGEISTVYRMISAGQAATVRYRDVRVALRAGYETYPALFIPGQGYHYINTAYDPERTGGAFDPTKPWILVYNKTHGRLTLSGVLYGMPAASTPQELARVFPASLAGWHQHINICATAQKILPIHDEATCTAQGAQFIASTPWVIHVWMWEPNTVSAFAMDLPRR